jgi:hypothetical protein
VKYGRHFACIFRSLFVRIGPYQHAPPGKRFEIRFCRSFATARRSYADAFRKYPRRRVRRFLTLANHHRRVRFGREPVQAIEAALARSIYWSAKADQ